ncbi:MAG: hypothetical protein GXP02_07810 [Alphaproteobacteria bacterium]|nr:hypothetical protein [Alphaproteobacteria bacterium]
MNEAATQDNTSAAGTVKIVYVLYLVGLVAGITGIIGVVIAYVNRSDAPDWLKSHYQFQIRTFWIGGLYMVIGAILAFVAIGWFVMLFWVIWLIVRCIKGLKSLDQKEPHPNPTGWMF